MTVREVTTCIKLTVTTKLDNHWVTTEVTIKTSRLILDLDFFNTFFSFFQFFLERLEEFINNLLPLFLTDFNFIEFSFHLGSEFNIHDVREEFDD